MKDIIFNSIDVISHRLDKELFQRNTRNYYEFNNSGKITNVVYQKQPDNLKSKNLDMSNKAKLIYSFENVSPRDFLRSMNNGTVTQTDLKIIEYLISNLKLKPGVVNVLIDYVLKTNDNKLTKAYVDFIASQWLKNHIEKVEDAIELAKKEFKKHNDVVKDKKTKLESAKWMDKKIESSIASKEEQEKMSKMLKELVGEK